MRRLEYEFAQEQMDFLNKLVDLESKYSEAIQIIDNDPKFLNPPYECQDPMWFEGNKLIILADYSFVECNQYYSGNLILTPVREGKVKILGDILDGSKNK